jgi:hypothetical protein
MAVTRERFLQGLTYEAFKAQMTRNRDRFDANERRLELDPADLACSMACRGRCVCWCWPRTGAAT